MPAYLSTKQLLLAAIMGSALVACGGGANKKDSAQVVSKPTTSEESPAKTLLPLDIPANPVEADFAQPLQVATAALKATLRADAGISTISDSVRLVGSTPLPSNSASGTAYLGLEGHCNPSGKYTLSVTEDEGYQPTDLHNQLNYVFGADFVDCKSLAGGATTLVNGQLDINLLLKIADLFKTASFSIDTTLTMSGLSIESNGKNTFYGDGSAGFGFATSDGYTFSTKLNAKNLKVASGSAMRLADFTSERVTDSRSLAYTITAAGKYTDSSTGQYVVIKTGNASEGTKPITGIGYGYPQKGHIDVTANGTQIAVDIFTSTDTVNYPEGGGVQFSVNSNGNVTKFKRAWSKIDLAELGFK